MRAALLLVLLLTSCDEGPAPELAYGGLTACEDPAHGTEAWFTETMLPRVFSPYCLYCHSVEREGAERHGAPVGLDYDVFRSAATLQATTWQRVELAEMPPLGALPSQEDYALLLEFLNCTSEDTGDFVPDLGACRDTAPTQVDVAPVFDEHCTRCHHSALAAGDRGGAPLGRDWDQPQSIRDASAQLLWQRIFEGGMPFLAEESLLTSDPEDARALYAYLSCVAAN